HLRSLGDLCGRGSEGRGPAAARRLHRRSGVSTRPPITLSIAGTDPSGGAGIHADLKTFTARGTLGTTVITALVAQNTHGGSRVPRARSEEHTSELQSRFDLVCRLLLEKKKSSSYQSRVDPLPAS